MSWQKEKRWRRFCGSKSFRRETGSDFEFAARRSAGKLQSRQDQSVNGKLQPSSAKLILPTASENQNKNVLAGVGPSGSPDILRRYSGPGDEHGASHRGRADRAS
jgi:hypothetical protein